MIPPNESAEQSEAATEDLCECGHERGEHDRNECTVCRCVHFELADAIEHARAGRDYDGGLP